MPLLFNRAKMGTSTTGTGTITLGSAITKYQTFAAAGASDADVVRYVIEDGDAWEIGEGTYTTSGTTLSRTLLESSTGSLLNLTGNAEVFIDAAAEDVSAGPTVTTVTISSDTTVDFTWTGAPREIRFLFQNVFPQNNATRLAARFTDDAGSTWYSGATDYSHQQDAGVSSSYGSFGSVGDTMLNVTLDFGAWQVGNGSGKNGVSGFASIPRPSDTGEIAMTGTTINTSATSNFSIANTFGGHLNTSTSIDGVQFLFDSGNLASGKIIMEVYYD